MFLTDEQIQEKAKQSAGERVRQIMFIENAPMWQDGYEDGYENGYKAAQEDMQPRPIYNLDKEFRGHLIGYTKLEKKILIFYIGSIDGYYYAIHHLSYFFIPPTLK